MRHHNGDFVLGAPAVLLLIFHTSPEMQELSKEHRWGTYGRCPCPSWRILAQTRVEACLLLKLELTHEAGLLQDGGMIQLV